MCMFSDDFLLAATWIQQSVFCVNAFIVVDIYCVAIVHNIIAGFRNHVIIQLDLSRKRCQ